MKMVHVLYGSIVAAAVVAGVRSFAGTPAPASDPTPVAEQPAGPVAADMAPQDDDSQAPSANPSGGIGGEVLEKIDVPSYSYLRVGQKGTEGTWVAVPTAPVQVGQSVRVAGAMKMSNFQSKGLNRTFETIYFGNLDNGSSAGAGQENPHGMGASAMGASPHGAGMSGDSSNPHGAAPATTVEVKAVPKADGANGKTVAEVIGDRTKLSGKSVRIRGTVVKVNGGILGKTYLHLRDGSGDATAGTNDIVVTTDALPELGATIVVEGNVVVDRDIGAGYKFPTMIEDAKLVN